ncbi:endonuclease domain-containing protein [Microbacterium sp.]|uniref:endonuclease domain-containing protein n=1 Tax=Microbacterium sp. TaxID=51671 RepID=UPI0039E423F4
MDTSRKPDVRRAPRLLTTGDLVGEGFSKRRIRTAVDDGNLLRVRVGAYCTADTDPGCIAAARLHGRLTCVSELRRRGVFVLESGALHVHVPPTSSRLPARSHGQRRHRAALLRIPHPRAVSVEPLDAVLHAVLCQSPRAAVATIDSALHVGLIRLDDLDELFAALPRRHRRLRRLVDGRAESGPESFMRLILRSLGCAFEVQVEIDGVGRVDFLVDGWLIVECDSKAHHSDWQAQVEDRRRDQEAALRGFATYRVLGSDAMWKPDRVRAALAGLLAAVHGRRTVGTRR